MRLTTGPVPEKDVLRQVRATQPVIHCITNYVTANDVANIVLAAGASPVMADGIREAEDIGKISQGLMLNLGTFKETSLDAMLLAGKTAAALGHPVVLDPVGVGAAAYRREVALRTLREVPCSVVRGNASEIRVLADALGAGRPEGRVGSQVAGDQVEGQAGSQVAGDRATDQAESHYSRGVDADSREALTEENFSGTAAMLQELSRRLNAVIVMTGATDLVADEKRVCRIRNGHPMMSRITGSGCMLDGILAAFLAAGDPGTADPGATDPMAADPDVADRRFFRTVRAVAAEGICGEIAGEMTERAGAGTGSFRMYLIDVMSRLTDEEIERRMKVEF